MPPTSNLKPGQQPNLWQRRALKSLARQARKNPGESLTPEDWEAYFRYGAQPHVKAFKRMLRSLPSTPRCGFCGAPFAGLGGRLVRPLGYRPSRKNPNICATCVELAPPGGMTAEAGVLFADLRGFTTLSETVGAQEASAVLRRFYRHAENVLFPEAIIDKLIGDSVMALYLPLTMGDLAQATIVDAARGHIAHVMLDHARELLARVGYGTDDGPTLELGIGLDYGEAFIGNIGDGQVQDFTAVGDVVNTASRLQQEAAGGEIVVAARLAQYLNPDQLAELGEPESLTLKGKQEPVTAYRLRQLTE